MIFMGGKVLPIGGGSSFDSIDYNKSASEMKVLERWKEARNDENYRALFTPEIREMSREIFNFVPF